MVTRGEHFHVDTWTLLRLRPAAFIRLAHSELSEAEEAPGPGPRCCARIVHDQLAQALAEKEKKPELSREEHVELPGTGPDPADPAPRADGVVGRIQQATGYLAAVSRFPWTAPVKLGSSRKLCAAGKVQPDDAVLDLMPGGRGALLAMPGSICSTWATGRYGTRSSPSPRRRAPSRPPMP